MTGLKQRILGRRSASPSAPEGPPLTDPQPESTGDVAPSADPSTQTALPPAVTPDDVPTISYATAPAPVPPDADASQPSAPAGAEPEEPGRPGFRERGRMRRRLRYLRRARELGLRDLGGLVFDLRRFRRQRFDLVEAKLQTLTLVDRELRTLEAALGDRRPVVELREAGIASCPRCAALTASDANFCSNCGLQISDTPPLVAAPAPQATPSIAAAPSAPAAPAAPAVSAVDAGDQPLHAAMPDAGVRDADPVTPPNP